MRIFRWMQNKVNGRYGSKREDPISANHYPPKEPHKREELEDWPNSLLAIGTFGNNDLKEDLIKRNNREQNPSPSHPLAQDIANEYVNWLQNELNLLLHKQVPGPTTELESPSFVSNHKLVRAKSSLEDATANPDNTNNGDQTQTNSVVLLTRGNDICFDNNAKKAVIGKKSLSFLLKRMLVCRSGLTPAPSIKDQIPESKMDKMLRAILHKKIYPQSTNPTVPRKKYISNGYVAKSANEEEGNEKTDDGSKWVKTDSEYIVLEI